MRKCINSMLGVSDAIEILIVDDGSTDETGSIADEYQAAYPSMVHAVHQENGGHGGAVMTGLRLATGRYFKVVDSDDRLDENALGEVVRTITALDNKQESVDLLICNYTYDKSGAKHKTAIRYGNGSKARSAPGMKWADFSRTNIFTCIQRSTALSYFANATSNCRSTRSMWMLFTFICLCRM